MGRAAGHTGPTNHLSRKRKPATHSRRAFLFSGSSSSNTQAACVSAAGHEEYGESTGSLTRTPDRSLGGRSARRTVAQPAGVAPRDARNHAHTRRDAPHAEPFDERASHVQRHRTQEEPRLLRALGIVGWNHLEPVILAALATESPLLLIGPHGSAKTLILTRLAEALGLTHRHYNASLLNFDDLVGFPVPDNGRLVYLQTPATIWDAESVLFDEISRCRPELQNKLFPIVHEKIVQGIALEKLRHRWGAMNPPPAADGSGASGTPEYAGAEAARRRVGRPLRLHRSRALARRAAAQRPAHRPARPRTDGRCGATSAEHGGGDPCRRSRRSPPRSRVAAADYVQILAQKLADADHPVSTRRAGQIVRNIIAVHATLNVLGGRLHGTRAKTRSTPRSVTRCPTKGGGIRFRRRRC